MKYLLIVLVISCSPVPNDWQGQWAKDNLKLKQIVYLLKRDKLKLINPRGTYQVPDTIDLKEPYGQLVYRQTDFTYDSSYSIVFYPDDVHKDESKFVFVFTDNVKRINEYENQRTSVVRIEDNWYCLDDSYSIENALKN